MFNRLTVLLCAFALLFLAACGGSRGGSRSFDDDYERGGGGGGRAAAVRGDELNEAQKKAVSLTDENHKLAREIFELKNRLGLPTDED